MKQQKTSYTTLISDNAIKDNPYIASGLTSSENFVFIFNSAQQNRFFVKKLPLSNGFIIINYIPEQENSILGKLPSRTEVEIFENL